MRADLPMTTLRRQRTLGTTAVVQGIGYWSGRDIRVEFRPAEPHTGLVFVRSDLSVPVRIPAQAKFRVDSPRRTTLQRGTAAVEMVEHVLAALAGLRIDNCEVWVDAPEMPGLDGSAQAFVKALQTAGIVEQRPSQPQLVIRKALRIGDQRSWVEAHPVAPGDPSCIVQGTIDYGADTVIGRQHHAVLLTPESFCRELSSARTFMLRHEAEQILQQGLAKHATPRDLLIFDEQGLVGNTLRFPNECVRHKLLDLVGDLALAGCDLVGRFVACCSGHRQNAQLVNVLLAAAQQIPGWKAVA